jgi:hypothetical protein
MMKNKKYIALSFVLVFLVSISLPSCNPHRRGNTASQIGAGGGRKYHRTPASAKRRRTSKYN